MHSILHCFVICIPSSYHWIHWHQQWFSIVDWSPWWLYQSRIIRCGTHIPLLCACWNLNAIVQHYALFNLYIPVVCTVIWMIQVMIPVKPSIGVHNALRSTICITSGCIAVDSCNLVNISALWLSPGEVLCRECQWQTWSFRYCKYSPNIMLNVWPGCVDHLVGTWDVSYGCNLWVLITRLYLCTT